MSNNKNENVIIDALNKIWQLTNINVSVDMSNENDESTYDNRIFGKVVEYQFVNGELYLLVEKDSQNF